jgi:hypothetical protein
MQQPSQVDIPYQNHTVTRAVSPADTVGSTQAQEVLTRFHLATRYVKRMKDVGKNELFTLTMCPEKYSIGSRTTPGQARHCSSRVLSSVDGCYIAHHNACSCTVAESNFQY